MFLTGWPQKSIFNFWGIEVRPSIGALVCLLAITGCETDQERMVKTMEKQFQKTIHTDWSNGLPLDDMVQAVASCRKFPSIEGCDILRAQMQDIAISLASCTQDKRSKLCQAFVKVVGGNPIAGQFPPIRAQKLPETPFYWGMPTSSLDALASNYNYRNETFLWWWKEWNIPLLSCLALLFGGRIVQIIWQDRHNAQQRNKALLARQQAERVEQERIRQHQQAQARAEAYHRAKQEHEAAIAREIQFAEEQAAKQKAAEASARLAAEQAEATELLNAVFKPSDSKRGEHGYPPE